MTAESFRSLFVVAATAAIVSADLITVNPSTRRLIDDSGRERYFHGVNVVYKGQPYHPVVDHFDPQYSFSPDDAKFLYSWGLNCIRLGMMWPGAEPARGQFNETYFAVMKQIMSSLEPYNIFALLDSHQDVLSEKFCGEGAPAWAAQPEGLGFPEPIDRPYAIDNATGFPSPADCNKHGWPSYYFAQATATAFQGLYKNRNGLQDSFAGFWKQVAGAFSAFPNLLGYELINEPFAGDIYEDPLLMVPGEADRRNLAPMYENLNAAIRTVDDQHLVFFEPVTWDDTGVGFDHVPGGDAYRNRSVLAYHFYVPPDINVELAFLARMRDLERLGCGGFMTEFDATPSTNGTASIPTMDTADLDAQSWMAWEYKSFIPITGANPGWFNSDGSPNMPVVKTFSRTYCEAVAGVAEGFLFNTTTAVFKVIYTINPEATQPTRCFLNEALYYPNGFLVTIEPATAASWNRTETNRLEFRHLVSTAERLTVTIAPK